MRSDITTLVPQGQHGHWIKGVSANPGGRPAIDREVVTLARQNSLASIRTLVELRDDKSVAPGIRAFCANSILDRAIGKPKEYVGDDLERAELIEALMRAMSASNVRIVRPGYGNER